MTIMYQNTCPYLRLSVTIRGDLFKPLPMCQERGPKKLYVSRNYWSIRNVYQFLLHSCFACSFFLLKSTKWTELVCVCVCVLHRRSRKSGYIFGIREGTCLHHTLIRSCQRNRKYRVNNSQTMSIDTTPSFHIKHTIELPFFIINR
jgi:hypothetical protein